jgi:hypothetical protein
VRIRHPPDLALSPSPHRHLFLYIRPSSHFIHFKKQQFKLFCNFWVQNQEDRTSTKTDPISAHTHTHPSHSQTSESRLFSTSLSVGSNVISFSLITPRERKGERDNFSLTTYHRERNRQLFTDNFSPPPSYPSILHFHSPFSLTPTTFTSSLLSLDSRLSLTFLSHTDNFHLLPVHHRRRGWSVSQLSQKERVVKYLNSQGEGQNTIG